MNILRKFTEFFFSRSLSVADWFAMMTISHLASHYSLWWLLMLIVWIPGSVHLENWFGRRT